MKKFTQKINEDHSKHTRTPKSALTNFLNSRFILPSQVGNHRYSFYIGIRLEFEKAFPDGKWNDTAIELERAEKNYFKFIGILNTFCTSDEILYNDFVDYIYVTTVLVENLPDQEATASIFKKINEE